MAGASTHDLPKRVLTAFDSSEWLSLPELARAFEISERTMRKHAAKGTLAGHEYGTGDQRVHRAFTRADAARFWHRLNRPKAARTSAKRTV